MTNSEVDSQTLFEIIKSEVLDHSFSNNIMAFISDGAPVFKGKINRVIKLPVLSDRLHIIDVHCLAHCTDIIAKKAFSYIDYDVESFLTGIQKHFAFSPSRRYRFNKLPDEMNEEELSIISFCQTRWLEILKFIERINKRWDILDLFFKVSKFKLASLLFYINF